MKVREFKQDTWSSGVDVFFSNFIDLLEDRQKEIENIRTNEKLSLEQTYIKYMVPKLSYNPIDYNIESFDR